MEEGFAIVVDIGKTLSKVTLWSEDGRLLARRSRPNENVTENSISRLDERGIAAFVIEAIAELAGHPVKYIIPVAHGAGVVAVKKDALSYQPLDYEQEPPAEIVRAYRRARDPFQKTGSPVLPAGLNFGQQLYWIDEISPDAHDGATFMPWPQYWAWFLSGEATSEVTSLGCHSDLWNPGARAYSRLAQSRGWAEQFAPLRSAGEVVGALRPELTRKTGLSPSVKVLAGLHDSNAALMAARGYNEIDRQEATVLSTGTWFVAMRLARTDARIGANTEIDLAALPEARDCLVNVDVYGDPVPSARFMGGREIETLIEIDTRRIDIQPDQLKLLGATPAVLRQRAMVMPTFAPGNGPFPNGVGGWINRPDDWLERRAGVSLYAALVADASLDLIGSKNRLLLEGRFGKADVFVRALASLRPDTEIYVADEHNDVSFGALRLINPSLRAQGAIRLIEPLEHDLTSYRAAWREEQKALA